MVARLSFVPRGGAVPRAPARAARPEHRRMVKIPLFLAFEDTGRAPANARNASVRGASRRRQNWKEGATRTLMEPPVANGTPTRNHRIEPSHLHRLYRTKGERTSSKTRTPLKSASVQTRGLDSFLERKKIKRPLMTYQCLREVKAQE